MIIRCIVRCFNVYIGMVSYFFSSVEKMDSFYLGLLEYVGFH